MGATVQPGSPRPVLTLPPIVAVAGLSDAGRALARPDLDPRTYVGQLLAAEHFADAVRVVAYALPKREAIWWAWYCARKSAPADPPPPVRTALDATERWIAQPTEEHRRIMMAIAEHADVGTPAGCTALAVFFSGGSIAPPEAPPVPPGDFVTAQLVAGAVTLASVAIEPEKAPETYRAFVAVGVDVANRIELFGKP